MHVLRAPTASCVRARRRCANAQLLVLRIHPVFARIPLTRSAEGDGQGPVLDRGRSVDQTSSHTAGSAATQVHIDKTGQRLERARRAHRRHSRLFLCPLCLRGVCMQLPAEDPAQIEQHLLCGHLPKEEVRERVVVWPQDLGGVLIPLLP